MFLVIELFFSVAFYQFFKTLSIFLNHALFFREKHSLQIYCFQFWYKIFQWLKSPKQFVKKTNFLKIITAFFLSTSTEALVVRNIHITTFKISRVLENFCPEKINRGL